MARHLRGGDTKWTLDAYVMHNEALRIADKELSAEKDRRYTEGNELRAMALKIKETADRDALELDRASQTYKETRNDALREQNLKETGIYATRDDLATVVARIEKTLKPLADYITAQKGAITGGQVTRGVVFASIAAAGTIIGIIVGLSVFLKG